MQQSSYNNKTLHQNNHERKVKADEYCYGYCKKDLWDREHGKVTREKIEAKMEFIGQWKISQKSLRDERLIKEVNLNEKIDTS